VSSTSITLAGLWPNKSGNGLSGPFDNRLAAEDVIRAVKDGWRVALFENDRRDNDKAPTHRIVLLPPREQQQPAQGVRRELEWQGYDVERASVERGPKGGRSRDELDDDIPFSAEWRV
jgi:hypothetical protein